MTNGGVRGFEERKFELGYFSGSGGKLTTSSSLYSSSLVIRIKGRMKEDKKKERKNTRMKSKVQLVEPILSFLVIQFLPPIDDPLILLLPPFFFFF